MTTTTKTKPVTTAGAEQLGSRLAFLTRVLKTPTIGRTWEQLADLARDQNWSHEEYLAAVLERQVADPRVRRGHDADPDRALPAGQDLRPLTQRQVVDALSRRLSGAVGNDPVAQGLRTEEIVHAIVGLVRGDQLDAAHELAARAARNAPDNPHLCNVLAFCLIPADRERAHRVLDRLDGIRDPLARGTAAMNRCTLFLADGDADQAEQAMAAVPDDGQIWCWDPVAMVRGEALLLGTTYADWRARASVALEQLRSRSAG